MIDICMLGTCGMMPMPERWLSSALLRCGATLTLFDCGEGTQIPWKSRRTFPALLAVPVVLAKTRPCSFHRGPARSRSAA